MEKRVLDLLKISLLYGLAKHKRGDEGERWTADDREEGALSSFFGHTFVGILPEGEPSEVYIKLVN